MKDMEKRFSFTEEEPIIYAQWEKGGYFAPPVDGEPYTLLMPPPNVTGSLHIGHAFNNSIQDMLARFARMEGRAVLWQCGTDHAGIATQMMVEKDLAKKGLPSRHELGRARFIEKIQEWQQTHGGTIERQLRSLGASCDWSRQCFTMDAGPSAGVREAFIRLYRDGLIYRDKRLVNWDPVLATAISDLEVENSEEDGKLWYIAYPLAEGDGAITVATTRPETYLGDTAVAVHPDDARYRHYIGREVLLPLLGRRVRVIGDSYVDPETGSGALKITPAHDANDYALGKRHALAMVGIFDMRARVIDRDKEAEHPDDKQDLSDAAARKAVLEAIPKAWRGLSRQAARKAILEALSAGGHLVKTEARKIQMPRGDRSRAVIEPMLVDQWYLDAQHLAQPALQAVEAGKTVFLPSNWRKIYDDWLGNIEPWCISRQLWWGHRIPAWYNDHDAQIFVARDEKEASAMAEAHFGVPVRVLGDKEELGPPEPACVCIKQEEDVLDTWFSSQLWPMTTQGWPLKPDALERHYPSNVLVTAFDIIFFWVARMIMSGLYFTGKTPFHQVYVHGLILDAKGQKMSKTRGNVIDPIRLMEKYGTDALRFTLVSLATAARDMRLDEKQVATGRNFCTKLWNASRFCLQNGACVTEGFDPRAVRHPLNGWMVERSEHVTKAASEAMRNYRFSTYTDLLYRHCWNEFCDWYVEAIKGVFQRGDAQLRSETQKTAAWALARMLLLLHPVMPFITEKLWGYVNPRAKIPLIAGSWPETSGETGFAEAAAMIEWIKQATTAIRNLRADLGMAPRLHLQLTVSELSRKYIAYLEEGKEVLEDLACVKILLGQQIGARGIDLVVEGGLLRCSISAAFDPDARLKTLCKEEAALRSKLTTMERRLKDAGFLANAPAQIVAQDRRRCEEARTRLEKLSFLQDRLKEVVLKKQ